jgi:hypothetical protein
MLQMAPWPNWLRNNSSTVSLFLAGLTTRGLLYP